jgi:hypothetical protein
MRKETTWEGDFEESEDMLAEGTKSNFPNGIQANRSKAAAQAL